MPRRIQLRRIKGWRIPPNTVNCARPGPYGNRYVIGRSIEHVDGNIHFVTDAAEAKRLYAEWLDWQTKHGYPPDLERLRGKDCACWCRLDAACHVDVILERANQ
ncbi:MAG: DUF4326 domain-containing protein [Sulfuricaulis sp.]|nr:DUF4326 domain-containing protein [Sulfuricaulis sp.]